MIYIGFIKCFNNLSAKNYLLQPHGNSHQPANAHIRIQKEGGLGGWEKWPDTQPPRLLDEVALKSVGGQQQCDKFLHS